MSPCLIVSSYNNPRYLAMCLSSVREQSVQIPVFIADDGSPKIDTIKILADTFDCTLFTHNKQAGMFRKNVILNNVLRYLAQSEFDYVLFTDQDCILERNWIQTHLDLAEKGYYVCGMYTQTSEEFCKDLGTNWSNTNWQKVFDLDTWYKSEPDIWAGNGSSAWLQDILDVNGFDERFYWSGDDYNMGLRMKASGVKMKCANRYTRHFHLWHERPYAEGGNDLTDGNRKDANAKARLWAKEPWAKLGVWKEYDCERSEGCSVNER